MGAAVARCRRFLEDPRGNVARKAEIEKNLLGFPESLKERFEIQEEVGVGPHGKIYRALEKSTGKYACIKPIWKDQAFFKNIDVASNCMSIYELRNCTLSHDCIVAHFGFYESKNLYCVATEFCEGGSVRAHFEKKLLMDDQAVSKIVVQMLHAVQYLHARDIVHRDLRPEQFLFSSRGKSKVKLSDLMHCVKPRSSVTVTDIYNPVMLLYAAPESLSKNLYSTMSDMWSMGCTIFELLYGHPPFTGEGPLLAYRIIEEQVNFKPVFSNVSQDATEMIRPMFSKDPYGRPSATTTLSSPWFQSASANAVQQRLQLQSRKAKLTRVVAEFQAAIEARQKRSVNASDDAAGQTARLRSQYSRSLTGTLSHLSASTISEQEHLTKAPKRVRRPSLLHEPTIDPSEMPWLNDSAELDFDVESARSDLMSGSSLSAMGSSRSGTWYDSDKDVDARAKGYWDEFDSMYFDEDFKASSCWNEAEFSTWSATSLERRDFDDVLTQYLETTTSRGAPKGKSKSLAKAKGKKALVAAAAEPAAINRPKADLDGLHRYGAAKKKGDDDAESEEGSQLKRSGSKADAHAPTRRPSTTSAGSHETELMSSIHSSESADGLKRSHDSDATSDAGAGARTGWDAEYVSSGTGTSLSVIHEGTTSRKKTGAGTNRSNSDDGSGGRVGWDATYASSGASLPPVKEEPSTASRKKTGAAASSSEDSDDESGGGFGWDATGASPRHNKTGAATKRSEDSDDKGTRVAWDASYVSSAEHDSSDNSEDSSEESSDATPKKKGTATKRKAEAPKDGGALSARRSYSPSSSNASG